MQMKRAKDLHAPQTAGLLIIAIGAMMAVYFNYIPYVGDDLVYSGSWERYYRGLIDYPLHFARNMLRVNGRMGDKLNIFWMCYLPRPALSIVAGAMVSLLLWLVIRSAHVPRQWVTARIVIVSLLMLTMPWWDSFSLFVCQFNYVWTSVFVLAVILVILNARFHSRWMWLMPPLAFMAAAMHEACGISASAGLAAYFYLHRSSTPMPRIKRWTLWLFFVGATVPLLSPAFWWRVGSAGADPDDPMWLLVLKSDFYALALTLFIVIARFAAPHRLAEMMKSSWTIYAVAAIVSMCISALGGIVGRSGWFAQTFALIAFFQWGVENHARISRRVGIALSVVSVAVVTFHLVDVVRWQRVTGRELERCLAVYEANPSQPVYMDFTGDERQPWWVLHKTRGVPDADDRYIIETITHLHGDSIHPLVVLPTALRGMDFSTLRGTRQVTQPYTAYNTLPPSTVPPSYVAAVMPTDTDDRMFCRLNGTTYVVVPFRKEGRQLYFLTPREQDPGDR